MTARFPAGSFFSVAVADLCAVSSSRPSIRACGSPAHGLPTPFTAGIRLPPPGLEGPGRDDGSVKAISPRWSGDS